MKNWYFQIDAGNIITDVISTPHEGYVEVSLEDETMPVGINAGCFRLIDGAYVKDQELYDAIYPPEVL